MEMSQREDFAVPKGPTFIPIETATNGDDVMFMGL